MRFLSHTFRSISFVVTSFGLAVQPMAQTCDAAFDIFTWKDVTIKSPTPEKTVPPVSDAGINSAIAVDMATLPYSMAGKLLTSVDGDSRYCTAQFVDANIIVTAAHCVRNKNGNWIDRLSFFPPNNRATPISDAKCIITPSNFKTDSQSFHWEADYAFIILTNYQAKDYFELEVSPSADDKFVKVIGFPKNIDGGNSMYEVDGMLLESKELGVVEINGEGAGTVIHGEPRFGLGISGGGWIALPKKPGQRFRILGLNGTAPLGVVAMGTRFGTCAQKALNVARQNCAAK